jgi:hypothetical protein
MNMHTIKRKFVAALVLLPFTSALTACNVSAMAQSSKQTSTSNRFNRIGLALVVDAVPGAEMLGVEFFENGDDEFRLYAKSSIVKSNRDTMGFPSGTVPETVRVTWRDNAKAIGRPGKSGMYYGGPMLGDHTIPVASRIPDEVIKEIRSKGGGLRLKFRLKPDGVLFGWDIERFEGGVPRHSMPGGDFREAGLAYELPGTLVYKAYLNAFTDAARVNPAAIPYLESGEYFIPPRSADIWRKAWYIDKDGRKILVEE